MSHHFIKVKKRQLKQHLSCPLCQKLLREATTICACLHTFCRECIYHKLVEEETNCCPVCQIYLGSLPTEKLRPDNNLQDVRTKLFPIKKRKMKASENIPLTSFPARRKERSLSSIVINTPPVTAQNSQSNRKGVARRSIPSKGIASKPVSGKCTEDGQDHSQKLDMQKKQRNLVAETETEAETVEDNKNNVPLMEYVRQGSGRSPSWGGLACLAEAANRSENLELKPSPNLPPVKSDVSDRHKVGRNSDCAKKRDQGSISLTKRKELPKPHPLLTAKSVKRNREQTPQSLTISRKRKTASESFESGGTNFERRNYPVWFALLASDKQSAESALPQIQKCYLRIKDGNVPVSYVKKYLVQKLNLKNEYEVEITCCGQPIVPSLSLYSLVEFWIRYAGNGDSLAARLKAAAAAAPAADSSPTSNPNPNPNSISISRPPPPPPPPPPPSSSSSSTSLSKAPLVGAEEVMMVLIYARKSSRG